jgi:hypothetical protein
LGSKVPGDVGPGFQEGWGGPAPRDWRSGVWGTVRTSPRRLDGEGGLGKGGKGVRASPGSNRSQGPGLHAPTHHDLLVQAVHELWRCTALRDLVLYAKELPPKLIEHSLAGLTGLRRLSLIGEGAWSQRLIAPRCSPWVWAVLGRVGGRARAVGGLPAWAMGGPVHVCVRPSFLWGDEVSSGCQWRKHPSPVRMQGLAPDGAVGLVDGRNAPKHTCACGDARTEPVCSTHVLTIAGVVEGAQTVPGPSPSCPIGTKR